MSIGLRVWVIFRSRSFVQETLEHARVRRHLPRRCVGEQVEAGVDPRAVLGVADLDAAAGESTESLAMYFDSKSSWTPITGTIPACHDDPPFNRAVRAGLHVPGPGLLGINATGSPRMLEWHQRTMLRGAPRAGVWGAVSSHRCPECSGTAAPQVP
jgi:hypothetical protein